jgi:hypothetical protein
MDLARRLAGSGTAAGVEADSERTAVEVATVREVLGGGLTDWATVGMVTQALAESLGR